MLPVTVIMLAVLVAGRRAGPADRPAHPDDAGPLLSAGGVLWLTAIGADASYLTDVLPAVLLFGAGLALLVAPLTATVLDAPDDRHAGIASGVNNAVARAAGLLAVAVIPVAAGIAGRRLHRPGRVRRRLHGKAMMISGVLLLAGAALAVAFIRKPLAAGAPPAQSRTTVGCASRPARTAASPVRSCTPPTRAVDRPMPIRHGKCTLTD